MRLQPCLRPYADLETTFTTDIPARMDRLPWSRWHWLVVMALGITWVIDGLEVTLIGAISPVLQEPETAWASPADRSACSNTAYLVGAVLGALFFGYLTDRLGRKKLFTVTLGLYLVAAFLTAFSWDFWSFAVLPVPHRRGDRRRILGDQLGDRRTDPGAGRGAGPTWRSTARSGSARPLGCVGDRRPARPRSFAVDLGWRLGFGIGAALGLVIIFFRNHVPESPRWLLTHGERRGGRAGGRRDRGRDRGDPNVGELPEPEGQADGREAPARRSASARSPRRCSKLSRDARCSAWRWSSRRRSCTTASSSRSP